MEILRSAIGFFRGTDGYRGDCVGAVNEFKTNRENAVVQMTAPIPGDETG